MRMVDLIQKKRDGLELTDEEIHFIIEGYTNEKIPDYQMSAWMMAVCFQGLNKRETATLTKEMMHSGDIIDLSAIAGVKVDKHSSCLWCSSCKNEWSWFGTYWWNIG